MYKARKFVLLPLAAVAVLLAVASAAWACTLIPVVEVQGQTVVTPPAGAKGSSVTVSGYGAKAGVAYGPYFLQNSAAICMSHDSQPLSSATGTANSLGTIPPVTGTIPTGAATGPAQICMADKAHKNLTVSTIFTVL